MVIELVKNKFGVYKAGKKKKGESALSISAFFGIFLFILVAVALLPNIQTTITASLGNFTGAVLVLLGLVVLMLVAGMVYGIGKSMGLLK